MLRLHCLLAACGFAFALHLGAAEPPVDGLGDPLPADAVARLGTRRLRHTNYVSAVVVSPAEKLAVSGDGDGNLVLWDLTSGKEISRTSVRPEKYEGPAPVSHLAISPDGKKVVTVCRDHIACLELTADHKFRPVKFGGDSQLGGLNATFTADSKSLATFQSDNTIRIWPLGDDKKPVEFEAFQGPVLAVAFSPDGKLLAAGDGSAIRIWDLATRKQLAKLRRHNGTVNALAFSPDGKLLASGGDELTIRLWDAAEGRELHRLGHPFTRPATQHFLADYNLTGATVAFTPDGKELVSSIRGDRSIRRWDVATGKERMKYDGHQDGSTCVALSKDGKTLVAGGEDSCLRIWDVATGKDLFGDAGHRGRVFNIAFAPDGKRFLSAGRDNLVRLWDLTTQKETARFGADADRIGLLAFAPDGKTVATARHDEETIQIWDAATGKKLRELTRKQYGVFGLAFGPEGKTLAAITEEDVVCLWDVAAGTVTHELKPSKEGQRSGNGSVAFSADGKVIAALGPDSTICLWDAVTGKERSSIAIEEERAQYFRVFLSPDGAIVAAAHRENTLSLYSTTTGKLLHKIGQLGLVRDDVMMVPESVAFSPDGRTLAVIGADSNLLVYEVASGLELRKFSTGQGWIGSVAFSPDGRTVASGGIDTTILHWDVTGLRRTPPPAELSADDLEKLWTDLKAENGPSANRAFWTLAASRKQSVPFFSARLKPAVAMEPARLKQLIADLDSAKFPVRQKATEILESNLDLIEGDLRRLLADKPPLEVRQRLEKMLEKVGGFPLPPDRLRAHRALGVLEQIGDPAARELLEKLKGGAAEAWLTRAAKRSLDRLPQDKKN